MKLTQENSKGRRRAGVSLIECLVYVVVFAILLGIGTASFYFCWDHTRATISTANEISASLRAGETWRADVRAAMGKISVTTTAAGESVEIPTAGGGIIYRFEGGELRRENLAQKSSRLLLPHVKSSAMKTEMRGAVVAWHWELEVTPHRNEARLPLLFSFAAVQT
jgi:hypothetical protein